LGFNLGIYPQHRLVKALRTFSVRKYIKTD